MKGLTYKYATSLSKILGAWIFKSVAWFIASGYFLLIPRRTMISINFYKALFPEKNFLVRFAYAWKQYHNFTKVFLDRFIFEDSDGISYTSDGWHHIEDAVKNKTGGILLMSHIGNWEVAAHLLRRKGIGMLLYMGIKEKEQLERMQKESLLKSGLKIIAVPQDRGSPFDALEGINYLKEGGLVSLTGDRIWRKDQRAVTSTFLGRDALFPETPHLFALLSGAPLFFFFVFRTGDKQYHFKISAPMYVKAESRSARAAAIQHSVRRYAEAMEETVRQYPCQWFHFDEFFIK